MYIPDAGIYIFFCFMRYATHRNNAAIYAFRFDLKCWVKVATTDRTAIQSQMSTSMKMKINFEL
jgi:hypothetical protein